MIVFVDTETTGLLPREGSLLEVALVLTDDDLIERAAASFAIKPITPLAHEAWVASLDPFIKKMHTKNGLLDDVRDHGLRRHEAEEQLVAFVRAVFVTVPGVPTGRCSCGEKKDWHLGLGGMGVCDRGCDGDLAHVCGPGCDPPLGGYREVLVSDSTTLLAGSTVGFDRAWLAEHMPALERLFHYRSIDVSSITELAKRWCPKVYADRPKAGEAHRALADVKESIAYLSYYRDSGFIGTDPALLRDWRRLKVAAIEKVKADFGYPPLDDVAAFARAMQIADLTERDRQIDAIAAAHLPTVDCQNAECLVCGYRDCPKGEPLHYDKDGCAARCGE